MMNYTINRFSANLQTKQNKFNSQEVILSKVFKMTDSKMTRKQEDQIHYSPEENRSS